MKNSRLKLLGLPIIDTIDDFSNYTNLSKHIIYQFSKNSIYYYKEYDIPKKSGGIRKIYQPSKNLKGLQSWILINILNKLKSSEAAKGFEKKMSLNDNVIPHRNSNVILNLDLKDFFPSIHADRVFNIFFSIGYNKSISTIFTNLCTYNDTLPQGSPCSPKLANLICWNLDNRIQGFVGKRGIIYTRYADDLTFSGLIPQRVIKILPTLKEIINDEDFKINNKKTRFIGLSRKREITGLILYKSTYGIGREKYRELRPKIFNLTKFDKDDKTQEKNINHINGWISYIKSVDKKRYGLVLKYIENLKKNYPKKLIISLK
jgi:RNA-directed DNA polymerase